jgi:hypothetical protein
MAQPFTSYSEAVLYGGVRTNRTAGVVERRLPEGITCQQKPLRGLVPRREREHAVQARHGVDVHVREEMRQHFAVGTRAENGVRSARAPAEA